MGALFILLSTSTIVISEIEINLNYDEVYKTNQSKKFDIRSSTTIECTIEASEGEEYSMKWMKDGKDLDTSSEKFRVTKDGKKHSLRIGKTIDEDIGNYSCVVNVKNDDEPKSAIIHMFSNFKVKTQDNMNFVEGDILRIPCTVYGKPRPVIKWKIGNRTYEESEDRVVLERDEEKGVDNAVLIIQEADLSDRGVYTCIGIRQSEPDIVDSDDTMVRIKDKYAALWPFLGICAEVFILCAIILIYEKKRNKAELDESDTDQSPDQKNTPDHGKDSNLRHRQ